MALRIHRPDHAARIEMTPLLDVIFLLLMFFMYSVVIDISVHVLPVRLPSLAAAQAPQAARIAAITVDASGALYLNREPITLEALEVRFAEIAAALDPPAVFVALEAGAGEVDRAPLLLRLIDLLRSAGIQNFHLVGQPPPNDP